MYNIVYNGYDMDFYEDIYDLNDMLDDKHIDFNDDNGYKKAYFEHFYDIIVDCRIY